MSSYPEQPEYEQKTITIRHSAGEAYGPTIIPAQISPCGLAYHQSYHGLYSGPTWTVTHVASGHALCTESTQFKNIRQCRAFISRVAPLADWSAEKPVLSEEMKATIRRIALDCQAMYNYSEVF